MDSMPDYTSADLEIWQWWAQKFEKRLLTAGITREAIAAIEIFDAGESVAMPLQSSKALIPYRAYADAEGWALCRWLVTHHAEQESARYRENSNRLEVILLTMNQVAISRAVDRGQRVTDGGKKGAQARNEKPGINDFLTEAKNLMDSGQCMSNAARIAKKKCNAGSLSTLKRHKK